MIQREGHEDGMTGSFTVRIHQPNPNTKAPDTFNDILTNPFNWTSTADYDNNIYEYYPKGQVPKEVLDNNKIFIYNQ